MRRHFVAILSVQLFFALVLAADIADYLTELPSCGLTCATSTVSEWSECDLMDTQCLCGDAPLLEALEECVLSGCNGTDALKMSQIQAELCELPTRSQKVGLLILVGIEALAFCCILLRMYSRWKIPQGWSVDDWLMVSILPLFTVFSGICSYMRITAFGVDMWTLSPDTITKTLKLFYIDEIIYFVLFGLAKLVFLFFFLRIFPQRRFRVIVYIVMAWVIIGTIIITFMLIFQCHPVDYLWNGWLDLSAPHKCVDVNALVVSAAAMALAQDVVILVLPMPLVMKLNTTFRKKMGIMLMFSLGIFVVITSCIRVRYVIDFAESTNPTWEYTGIILWSGLEISIAIIVICLPAIRLLLVRITPKVFASTRRSSTCTLQGQGRNSPAKYDESSRAGRWGRSVREKLSVGSTWGGSKNTSDASASTAVDGPGDRPTLQYDLELGDKMKGETQTQITVEKDSEGQWADADASGGFAGDNNSETQHMVGGDRDESHDEALGRSGKKTKDGVIHVRTTMTKTVGAASWQKIAD